MVFLNKVADILILDILLIVFSIPVFTAGASLSAAYYIAFKMVKNEETYIIRGFWKAFKENFRQGTIIWLIILVVLGILTADYRIIFYSGFEFASWIQIALGTVTFVLLLGVVFIFPVQARFINSVGKTIKNAFLMALSHLPTALLAIVIHALPVLGLGVMLQILPLILFFAFGLAIYINAYFMLRVFRKYEEVTDVKSEEGAESDSGIFAESDRIEREGKTVKVFRNGRFVEVPENSLKKESK